MSPCVAPLHRPELSPVRRPANRIRGIRTLPVALAALLPALFLVSGSGFAQEPLNPEVTLSTGPVSEAALRIFDSGLVYVVHVESGAIVLQQGPSFGGAALPLGDPGIEQRRPGLAISSTGTLTLLYEADDPSPSALGPEILYRTASGAGFGPANPLSANPLPDEQPSLSAPIGFGARDAAWTRIAAGGGAEILFSLDLAPPVSIATGGEPDLHTGDGLEHELVYLRDGRVRHRSRSAGGWSGETTISGLFPSTSGARVAGDAAGAVHATFLAAGKCWYVRRAPGGSFGAPIEVTPGVTDVDEAELVVEPSGLAHIFFRSGGDVWVREGALGIFAPSVNLFSTPGDPEEGIAAGIDELGSIHLVYRRGGLLRYRNNVPPPAADFSHLPVEGDVPLTVDFTDLSSGVIDARSWDFGDGAQSTEADPSHTYASVGTYDVTLTVSGPGGVDSRTVSGAVVVRPPSNILRIPAITVIQYQPDVAIPVLATHPEPLQGFQNGITWDPSFLQIQEATFEDTPVVELTPEFFVINLVPGPTGATGLTAGVIFDFIPPFDGRVLDPGVEQRILHLIFDIPGNAPANQTTGILFDDTIGEPPVLNIFIVNGLSRVPVQVHGQVHVLPFTFPPPTGFLRGDFDNSQGLLITDAVQMLAYLFSGGAPPSCPDAADANDSGSIEITDPIYLLGFLFGSTNAPPYPWPTVGLDPTSDPLGDC